MSEPIIFKQHQTHAEIILNRPESFNALNEPMLESLQNVIHQLQQSPDTRCVWLKANGKHFMAGGDVKLFATLTMPGDERALALAPMMQGLHTCMQALADLPMPIVTSVQGAVAGFGLGLMMASDFVFASEKAYFNLAYIRLGLCPDGFVTYWLPRKVGLTRAISMALLGQTISPQEAKADQLINEVVPAEVLMQHSEACVHMLCQQSQLALRHTKKLLRQSLESSMAQQSEAELRAFSQCVQSDDFIEGVSAFIQKRKPDFQSQS